MRKFLGFAAVATFALTLVGCGDKGGGSGGGAAGGAGSGSVVASGPAGTWVIDGSGLKEAMRPKLAEELEKGKAGLKDMPAEQREMAEKMMPSLDKMLDMAFEQMSKMSMELTLDAGGAASFTADKPGQAGGTAENGKGTWKLEGDKVVITPTEKNGKPVTEEDKKDVPPLFFKNGKLMMEADGLSIPFKRK
jgi:hypothetical protein